MAFMSAADGVGMALAATAPPVGYQPSVRYCRNRRVAPAIDGLAMLVPE